MAGGSVFTSIREHLLGKGSPVEECDVQQGTGYEKLTVKENVCYIVVGIVLNQKNEVLVIQEAKSSCYGKWYLPAGRMEQGETIVEAAKREVLEEAGLEFEAMSLLCVEECGGRWVRFSLIGKAVGGSLKTTDQADDESVQAMWWNREDEIPIRCRDVLPLIQLGLEWKEMDDTLLRPCKLLPAPHPQSLLFLRILLVHANDNESSSEKEYSILLIEETIKSCPARYRIPTSRIHPNDRSFRVAVAKLCSSSLTLEMDACNFEIACVTSVEHTGASSEDQDGVGIGVVANLHMDALPLCKDPYKWTNVKNIPDEITVVLLREKLGAVNVVPLRSLKA